jgi:hypothetical protein
MNPAALLTPMLAWTPILEPLPLTGGQWWITIIPLALGIAIAYKAVRYPDIAESWTGYLRAVGVMTAQILLLILGLAVGLHIVVTWAAPALGG